MLDDFREQAGSEAFIEEELPAVEERPRRPARRFLGMTPQQRFVISLMLLMITCILSSFCLLVTEKIYLPFL